MSELSTPTETLAVVENKVDLQPAPQVDISGVVASRPDYTALGQSALGLAETISLEYDKATAKEALNEYERTLGDLQRNYVSGNNRGSPEEMKVLQNETQKAWTKFSDIIRKVDPRARKEVIGDANRYGRKYRDSMLNAQAKFVEDLYLKNQNALIAGYAEDVASTVGKPKSEEHQTAVNKLIGSSRDLLYHQGLNENDASFQKGIKEALSQAILSGFKFHIGNDDYKAAWEVYQDAKKRDLFSFSDRTTAIDMLKILEDELAAKSASSGGSADDIAYDMARGVLDARQNALVVANRSAREWAYHKEKYETAEKARREEQKAYDEALKNGATKQKDGSLIDKNGDPVPKPRDPYIMPTAEQIANTVQAQLSNELAENREKTNEKTATRYQLDKAIDAIRVSERTPDFVKKQIPGASLEELIALSGKFKEEEIPMIAENIRNSFGSEKEFDEWLYTVRHGSAFDNSAAGISVLKAENVSLSTYLDLAEMARKENITLGTAFARRFDLVDWRGDRAADIAMDKYTGKELREINEFRNKRIEELTNGYMEIFIDSLGYSGEGAKEKAQRKQFIETKRDDISKIVERVLDNVVNTRTTAKPEATYSEKYKAVPWSEQINDEMLAQIKIAAEHFKEEYGD